MEGGKEKEFFHDLKAPSPETMKAPDFQNKSATLKICCQSFEIYLFTY